MVYGLVPTCLTGFCGFSENSLSLPGSSLKAEAESRAYMEVVYFEKSPQESGERDWDEGNKGIGLANEWFNTKQAGTFSGVVSQNDQPKDGRGGHLFTTAPWGINSLILSISFA